MKNISISEILGKIGFGIFMGIVILIDITPVVLVTWFMIEKTKQIFFR